MPAKDTITLTDPIIRNLKPKENEYTIREKGGFGVRVLPSKHKTFFYLYRIDGHRKFLNLGDYPKTTLKKARDEYEAEKAKVKALKAGRAEGVDPLEHRKKKRDEREEQRNAFTVSDLVTEYIERHAKRFKRSWKEDERILNKEVIPLWGKQKAAEIVKRDVNRLLEEIIDRGAPASANNAFQVVRKMFNYAVEKDILPFSPCTGLKLPAPKIARERALSEAEIKSMWSSLNKTELIMSDDVKKALKLILVTAQRPGEIAGIHTDEIDDRWWTIPAERSKNGKSHRVYLTDMAFELLGPMEITDRKTGETKARGFFFPCPHKKKACSIDDHALAVAVRRNRLFPVTDKKGRPVKGKDGIPLVENKLEIDHWSPHDLRRTAATFMAQRGEMDEVIDAVLNHSKQGVIKVYNQYRYDREKQIALETWEIKLRGIIGEKAASAVVIPINRQKAS